MEQKIARIEKRKTNGQHLPEAAHDFSQKMKPQSCWSLAVNQETKNNIKGGIHFAPLAVW